MKKILFAISFFMISSTCFGQQDIRKLIIGQKKIQESNVVYGKIIDGDTLLIVNLPEVDINMMQDYYEIMKTRQGRRLVRNIKKVYPYAKNAGLKLQEYDSLLIKAQNDHARRILMKKAEEEIMVQYGEELKDLTFTQGNILIRLIDRETGNTSYSLVKDLRGRLRAAFYQGFARIWGYNLKTEYDPKKNTEDATIETIITLIDRGCI
jgi:hypothetical protein